MKRRWAIAAMAALICVSVAIVGTAEASAGTIQRERWSSGYDKCPQGSICLYQNGNGTGSKAIIVASRYARWNFWGVYFLNSANANDQVTSVYNNTTLFVTLYVDFDCKGTGFGINPGGTMDYSYGTQYNAGFNDKFSSLTFT